MLLGLAAGGAAQAAPQTGSFLNDDDLAVFTLDLTGATHLHASTSSWAAGGFATVLAVFDTDLGTLLAIDMGSQHVCGPGSGAADPGSGFCWDAVIDTFLLPGHYALVLSQDGNAPTGDLPPGLPLDAVYPQTGIPDYTGLAYLGLPGHRFINVDATPRSGLWELTIDATPDRAVPEPGTGALVLAVLGGVLLRAGSVRRTGGAALKGVRP